MTVTQLLYLSLTLLPAGALAILLLPYKLKPAASNLFTLAIAATTSVPAVHVLLTEPIYITLAANDLFGPVSLYLDALSAWFILIINLTSITSSLYGAGYIKPEQHSAPALSLHWTSFLLFQVSMIWVCVVQNSLLFLVVWELMTIASFLLILFDHTHQKTLKAALNYLVQMHVGIVFLTIGFIWVFITEGALDFLAIRSYFTSHTNVWLFLVFFTGFGIKAGFIPLHSWLPHAHPAAPSHVSGIMSGVIVKMGIYGILRITGFLDKDMMLIGQIVLGLSLLTGLYGIINASVHRDFKRMLAYCTIENIGIIGAGIGLGIMGYAKSIPWLAALGFGGALLHSFNHSLFKSLLFFSAGSVYRQTHTRDMEKLGGLIHKMPQTAMLFLIGSLAISGLPPFSGFISEFLLYTGFVKGFEINNPYTIILMVSAIAAISIIGGISIFSFSKTFGIIFLGTPRTSLAVEPVESNYLMRLPQYIILIVIMVISAFPVSFFYITSLATGAIVPGFEVFQLEAREGFATALSSIGLISLLFLSFIVVLFYFRLRSKKATSQTTIPTWGCGYAAPGPSMQYTGKSYSKTVGKILNFVVPEKKRYKELREGEVFPSFRNHSSFYTDLFESKVLEKITRRLLAWLNLFQFVQNGSLQRYILYGLFFILAIFIATLFSLL
jgi:formate hydrogenlyase subunit 3/multisubunit Na+/H+ antiporter MnhD subunit